MDYCRKARLGRAELIITYCVIPRELGLELHEPLRDFFRDDRRVHVVVERRRRERRDSARRQEAGPARAERRDVQNTDGRRVAERRAPVATVDRRELPPEAAPYADRLIFVERRELSSRQAEDADSARLVIRAQQGDSEAVGELYLRYYASLHGYLTVLLKDPHEAEDLVQEVFARILRILPRYQVRPSQPFRVLLYRIARNRSVDHFRKAGRTDVEEPSEIQRLCEAAGRSEREILDNLEDSDLAVLLRQLPETQLHVLLLRYMLDFTPDEVAAVVKTSPGAARTLQYRALKHLRARLLPAAT